MFTASSVPDTAMGKRVAELADFFGASPMPVASGIHLAAAWRAYCLDTAQRTALFLDLLRQRGDEQASMSSRPMATVLSFEHRILMSGHVGPRPMNYSLAEVIPPTDTAVDPAKRPVVIVDPRAGQGPGIGGFHYESEIGDALAAGHPVYFIGFSARPVPRQTFLDVVEGQVRFFEHVAERHPLSPRPLVVGNCQAGYQTLMVAMLRPDLFGPVLLAGSPMSYWQGVHGKNPMRYEGGLVGGSWLTRLTSDLGDGKVDGAFMIGNFDNLNPGHTLFGKLYDVFRNVDTEGPRFLEFERWWGDLIHFNGEEVQYLVDRLFIGDELTRNQLATADGRKFDIRDVTSPIIVLTSEGDNISPPQQTLGWILDLYESIDDIWALDKTIVYCVDPKVGHLAIFVSPKVADKEDEVLVQMIDFIAILPPGLYEVVIAPKDVDAPGAELVHSDFFARIEPRTLDDIRAIGRNSAEDNRAFEAVKRLSEMTSASYEAFVSPLMRMVGTPKMADLLEAMNPVRLQYTLFESAKPWMRPVAGAAEKAKADRRPVDEDNPFLALQERIAEAVTAGFDQYRDLRDQMTEQLFFAFYGSRVVQAMLGVSENSGMHWPPAKTSAEREAVAQKMAKLRDEITRGGTAEGRVRAVLWLMEAERGISERTAFALNKVSADFFHAHTNDEIKSLIRGQFFSLHLDEKAAVEHLPVMVRDADERQTLLAHLDAILAYGGGPSAEASRRLAVLRGWFDSTEPDTPPATAKSPLSTNNRSTTTA